MRERLKLEGRRFGDYVVVKFSHIANKRTHWLCRCIKCGAERTYGGNRLMFKQDNMHCYKCYVPPPRQRRKSVMYDNVGKPYKEVLPSAEWPKAEAFCRVVAFLKRYAKQAERKQVSLEAIKAAVNNLLEAR